MGKFRDSYSLGETLGTGAFGEVRRCISKETQALRAVKIIKKSSMDPESVKSFQYELSILKKLDHPNIIKLYEVFEDGKHYYLVQELCKGGELFDEIIN